MNELQKAADEWRKAKKLERERMIELREAIQNASQQGISELEIARQTKITRITVRRALGKSG